MDIRLQLEFVIEILKDAHELKNQEKIFEEVEKAIMELEKILDDIRPPSDEPIKTIT